MGLVEELGREWTAEALAARVMRDAALFESSGGGVTLSGGEPLLQHEFAEELLRLLPVHKAIETSGFASADVFTRVIDRVDYVMMDLKLIDPALHRRYCGVDNEPILRNFELLRQSGKPYLVRVPLIPDITDTDENLRRIAAVVGDSPVELLPYNRMAGAKYPSVGKSFTDLIAREENREIDLNIFQNATLRRDAH
jgi:pyruvate formate lyase activating enzyme